MGALHDALGEQQVGRVADGGAEGEHDADEVDRRAAAGASSTTDDAGERQDERGDAAAAQPLTAQHDRARP